MFVGDSSRVSGTGLFELLVAVMLLLDIIDLDASRFLLSEWFVCTVAVEFNFRRNYGKCGSEMLL